MRKPVELDLLARIKKVDLETTDRIKKLESRRSWAGGLSLGALLTAGIALYGHWSTYAASSNDTALNQKALRMQHLESMSGTYDQRKAMVKRVAMVYGVDTAIDFAESFKSGATIGALEELQMNASEGSAEYKRLSKTLSNVPLIMFVDSNESRNNYCSEFGGVFSTNVDDIYDLIKDFPVRVEGRVGEVDGVDGLAERIKAVSPALLVLHVGAFEGLAKNDAGTTVSDAQRILELMTKLNADEFKGRVLVYSRGGDPLDAVKLGLANAPLGARLKTVHLRDRRDPVVKGPSEPGDADCFSEGSRNGKLIVRAIRSAIQSQRLYVQSPPTKSPETEKL